MEFESEDSAKIFYDEYARRLGFVMRVMSCRRSERDGKILARRLGCNKEGHCVSIRGKFGPVRKPRPSTREGCKAMIHVKYDKSGKWVITKFVKDHNHPLVVSPREARQTMVSFLISYIIFCCSIFTILSLHYLFNKSISLLWVYLLLHIHYNDYLCFVPLMF
ncbi:protein FAR1-RELATED SEQUENCE 5 isoform X2 [Quercus suber]